MKERPILFSAPMVLALLEGRKTQTRRVIKPQPEWDAEVKYTRNGGPLAFPIGSLGQQCGPAILADGRKNGWLGIRNPYGSDRVWVREAWSKWENGGRQIAYRADGRCFEAMTNSQGEWMAEDHGGRLNPANPNVKWKPSIHMYRWMSRITLEITEVRVQRLQEISEADAIAEGLRIHENPMCSIGVGRYMYTAFPGQHSRWSLDAVTAYRELWESINGAESWAVNPWVWAVTFKVVTPQPDSVPCKPTPASAPASPALSAPAAPDSAAPYPAKSEGRPA